MYVYIYDKDRIETELKVPLLIMLKILRTTMECILLICFILKNKL